MTSQATFAQALLDPDSGTPATCQTPSTRRFAVYRNNVISSLSDALADTFPVTQTLVGEEFFRAMAQVFIRQSPPNGPVLTGYGAGFADFIEHFAPAASVPYLADVARLEFAYLQSLHAADAAPMASDELSALLTDEHALAHSGLRLHPALSVHQGNFAAVSIWAAHQGHGELSQINTQQPEQALLTRPQLAVEVTPINTSGAQFITCLQRGNTLAQAWQQALAQDSHFDLTQTLSLLLRQHSIVGVQQASHTR
ncbi:HvfC/BufC N-terminal domain-containing protein [Atopomonas sediminilitoris]|uniref:HvfC/BufC N-terminal domain-containing protein n=1 Tax=Atopomonas sediminilitoris TaxID=2919919 RepID=UPI001F4E5CA3|nr:DNA-binding domain-containing protein [Atopomonas sediminilitoris]MCJ8169070.1 putative DNA-binding domain-containing protein [Atopomonas sediminilitoris]